MTTVLDALQRALAAEHQAVFGYQALGPRTTAGTRGQAQACEALHERVRDQLITLVAAAGADPVAGAAQYAVVTQLLRTPRTLAARLEDECAAAWRFVYAVACGATPAADGSASPSASPSGSSAGSSASALRPHGIRTLAQRELTASAVRAVRWRVGGEEPLVQPFPGA